jgi:hypothetical protein
MDTQALCPSTGRPLTRAEIMAIVAAEPELVAGMLELLIDEVEAEHSDRPQPRVQWGQGEDGNPVAVAGRRAAK